MANNKGADQHTQMRLLFFVNARIIFYMQLVFKLKFECFFSAVLNHSLGAFGLEQLVRGKCKANAYPTPKPVLILKQGLTL